MRRRPVKANATFVPKLDVLPRAQRLLWAELDETPEHFTLYGGTALALRIGHRSSVDFDFFSDMTFDPDVLARALPYLAGAERVQVAADTLTCREARRSQGLCRYRCPDPSRD